MENKRLWSAGGGGGGGDGKWKIYQYRPATQILTYHLFSVSKPIMVIANFEAVGS